jgi:multiple sugar transport system substrate-binding protein
MKKASVVLLSLALLLVPAVIFAGGSSESKNDASGKPIELVYWSHYGQSPAFVQAFADAANVALKNLGYDNVTCRAEVIEYSGYETKYLTAFTSGNGPDMFLARPSDWALEGGLNPIALPLPDDVAKAWDDALASVYVGDGVFNGKRYGFPSEGGSLQLLYINTDYMKEAGLNPETDYPKTIEEFVDVAKKMTKYDASGNVVRSGYQPRYLGGGEGVSGKFIPFIHVFGGRVLSEDLTLATGYINGPEAKSAFQFNKDLVYKDKVVNLDFGAPETAFQSGQTAMIFREGWFAQNVLDKAPNINFMVVPYISGAANPISHAGSGIWCNMINSRSKHADICAALFKELAKPEYDVMLHEPAGYPPVLAATMTLDNAYFGKMPYAQAVIDSLSKDPAPIYDISSRWSSVAYMLGDSVAAGLGGADVSAELDKLPQKMQGGLNQK